METSDSGDINWDDPLVGIVPVVDWEIPTLRKLIPLSLQQLIGVATPIIRVSRSVDQKQRRKHREDVERYERLTEELRGWRYARLQPYEEAAGSKEVRWQVVFFCDEDSNQIPILTVLELRTDGVLYFRSMHRRQQQWGDSFEARSGVIRRGEG